MSKKNDTWYNKSLETTWLALRTSGVISSRWQTFTRCRGNKILKLNIKLNYLLRWKFFSLCERNRDRERRSWGMRGRERESKLERRRVKERLGHKTRLTVWEIHRERADRKNEWMRGDRERQIEPLIMDRPLEMPNAEWSLQAYPEWCDETTWYTASQRCKRDNKSIKGNN